MYQPRGQSLMNLHFCNPGEYQVNLSINFQSFGNQNQFLPQIGMPQQQPMPAVGYGHAQQYIAAPYNNGNGQGFPRPDSTNSLMNDASYSSQLSTPGIASDSWSYTTPQDFYPNPPGSEHQAMKNGFANNNNHPPHYSFTSDDSFAQNFKAGGVQATSTPTKTTGCFSAKNCSII